MVVSRMVSSGGAWLVINGSSRSRGQILAEVLDRLSEEGAAARTAETGRFGDVTVTLVQAGT
jgi:hypothetical protein